MLQVPKSTSQITTVCEEETRDELIRTENGAKKPEIAIVEVECNDKNLASEEHLLLSKEPETSHIQETNKV